MYRLASSLGRQQNSLRKQILSPVAAVSQAFEGSTVAPIHEKSVVHRTLENEPRDTISTIPNHADVVVLGGGAIGCSTLYYLTKLGVKNSVLIEKEQITAGTTWHTAGMNFRVRNTETETRLAATTRTLVDEIREETGVDTGYLVNGALTIASSKAWLSEAKQLHTFSKALGIETHMLTPSEVKDVYPNMNTDDIYGAMYSPGDGSIDPAGYCEGVTRAAKARGAQIFTGTMMTEIETYIDDTGRKRVKAVHTDKGRIETDAVVVCGGCWTPYMLEPLGISVPQYQMKHTYVITEGMTGITGMPNVRDPHNNFYLRTQGDAVQIGSFEQGVPMIDGGQVAEDFAFGLYEMDWDTFAQPVENACHRVPAIGEAGIKSTVCGPESFTPDGHGMLGPNSDITGLYHAHTMNSSGMSLAGGVGKMLAQWVVNGEPEMSMFNFDARRWNPKLIQNKDWIKEMTYETFSNFYNNHWPFDEPLAGRTHSIKDPLYQTLLEDGCLFEYRGGWERSGYFNYGQQTPALHYDYDGYYGYQKHGSYPYRETLTKEYTFDFPEHHHMIGEECMNTRNKANLFNMSYFGKLYLSGTDATKAADWIFSNNMDKEPGATTYTCMLNKLGGIESDLTVSVVDDDGPERQLGITDKSYYVAAGGRFAPYVKSRMCEAISEQKFDCKVDDITYDMVLLSLQGPLSREILSRVSPAVDLSNEKFPFSTHQVIDVAGHKVRAMRVSFVGELGWEIHAPNSAALDVYHALHKAGKDLGLKNSGYRAMDSLSMEKGYRMWTSDIRSDDSPLEADLAFTCKLKTDKPFLGREALERYKSEGITKRLVCFTLPNPSVALHGREVIYRDGDVVGYIRRAEYAFSLDTVIAWGYITNPSGGKINRDYIMSGKYQLERMNELLDANVHMKSPFDPKHRRIQGFYDEDCLVQQRERLQL